jgi:CelD/BcsL family acetyltransferase involved in cellulose biosynthesis
LEATLRNIGDLTSSEIAGWNNLLRQSAERSAFLSHGFCRAVEDVRGNVRALIIRDEKVDPSFFAFQIRRGRSLLGHAEQVGGNISDHFGFVGSPSRILDSKWLLQSARISALRFDHGIRESLPFQFSDREEVRCVAASVNNLPRYMDSIRATDKEFFKDVARSQRRLEREIGPLRFELHASDPLFELNALVAAKSEQYRKSGAWDGFAAHWRRQVLQRLLMMPDDPLCRPFLSSLYCGDKWLASHLGLACADVMHIWYPVYAPEFRKFSPGHILFFKIIEEAFERGIRKFDFGAGEAKYKSRYGTGIYTRWKGVLRTPTVLGCAEGLLESISWRANNVAASYRHIFRA